MGRRWSPILWLSARHQPQLQDHEHGASVSHDVPVYSPDYAGTRLYCLVTEARVCKPIAPKVALDSAAAVIEPAISSCKSNSLTTTPPSHTVVIINGIYTYGAEMDWM